MSPKWISFFVVLLCGLLSQSELTASASQANLTTLRVVQIIFRHGARNIDRSYPLDPYRDESHWPPGYFQLTNIGKLQGYNLGVYLRERYNGFVKDYLDNKEIYVQSSDVSRTMQTASSVMAGFYLPNELPAEVNLTDMTALRLSEKEIPLPWKSVPIHTVPLESDTIIRQRPNCPRYTQLLNQVKSDSARPATEEDKRLYEFVNKNTGANITNSIDLNLLLDTISVEKYFNLTMPSWVEPVLATNIVGRSGYFIQLTKTFEMKRLRVGPLLQRLSQNMLLNETSFEDEFQRSRDGQKKIYFFSGHDETIAPLLNTLGMYDNIRPPYASAVLMELHQNPDSQEYYVEFYYRNETDREPYLLQLPNCSQPCTLPEYLKLVEPYIPTAWSQECQAVADGSSLSGGWIALIVIAVWVLLFVAVQCWIRSGRKRRSERNKNLYTHLK